VWRQTEEDRNCVEFVKVAILILLTPLSLNDTHARETRMVARRILHASRNIPSLFARDIPAAVAKSMSKNILNVYAKCPVGRFAHSPLSHCHVYSCSIQLEGTGCQASISYKTYFDSDQVRACCKLAFYLLIERPLNRHFPQISNNTLILLVPTTCRTRGVVARLPTWPRRTAVALRAPEMVLLTQTN